MTEEIIEEVMKRLGKSEMNVSYGRKEIEKVVENKIKIFGSINKA